MTNIENTNFKKWQEVHKILEGWCFKIAFEFNNKFWYIAEGFDGYIYYNIEKDLFRIKNSDDEVLEEFQDEHLNLFMIEQALIEWVR